MPKCIVDVCICLCRVYMSVYMQYERYMCKYKYVCVCFLSHMLSFTYATVAQESSFSVSFISKLSMASCNFPGENCFYQAGVDWF